MKRLVIRSAWFWGKPFHSLPPQGLKSLVPALLLACALGLANSLGATIGGAALPVADSSTYQNGVGPHAVSLVAGPGFSFNQDAAGTDPRYKTTDYAYDAATGQLWIENQRSERNVKHVSLHINYSTGLQVPQLPNEIFDPAFGWPSILGPSSKSVLEAAAVVIGSGSYDLYLNWRLVPQPELEIIDLGTFFADRTAIKQIHVNTICTPDGSTGTLSLLALAVGCLGAKARRLRGNALTALS